MGTPAGVLLDTSVLIDVLRNRNQRRSYLAGLLNTGHALAISTMSVAEIHSGLRPGEEKVTKGFLNNLIWYPVSGAIAERAGGLKASLRRQGHTRSLADMIVAATALENGLDLATDNRKDFAGTGLVLLELP
jgi:predicted nucleic acid-binding protein